MTGEFVNVVNRSKSELTVTFDGRSFVLQPGKNTIDACMAGHARRQHRIMGTEDPSNPLDFDSLVALPGDDDSPAEQSNKIEAMDRRLMPEGQRNQLLAALVGLPLTAANALRAVDPSEFRKCVRSFGRIST